MARCALAQPFLVVYYVASLSSDLYYPWSDSNIFLIFLSHHSFILNFRCLIFSLFCDVFHCFDFLLSSYFQFFLSSSFLTEISFHLSDICVITSTLLYFNLFLYAYLGCCFGAITAILAWLFLLYADTHFFHFSDLTAHSIPDKILSTFDPDYRRRRRIYRRYRDKLLRAADSAGLVTIADKLDSRLRALAVDKPKLFLVHDSGATRNLLCGTSSPFLPFLRNKRPAPPGQVTVGGGRALQYAHEGEIAGITFTTVPGLKYDLYSAVAAAKRGVSTCIDYGPNGENRSYLHDKRRGVVTPLLECGGMLTIPMDQF